MKKAVLSIVVLILTSVTVSLSEDPNPTNVKLKDNSKPKVVFSEITSPEALPTVYEGEKLEPTVRLRNEGTKLINSVKIVYEISKDNTGVSFSFGPLTTWNGNLNPGEEVEVGLKPYSQPLHKGTHLLRFYINQVNGEHPGKYEKVSRVFSMDPEGESTGEEMEYFEFE